MKAKFIKKLALGFFAVSMLGLYSCVKDDAASVITKSTPSQESTFPAGEIARVSLKLSMGHLHGRQDFHFVPSSGKYDLRNIYDSQEFTFEKKGIAGLL